MPLFVGRRWCVIVSVCITGKTTHMNRNAKAPQARTSRHRTARRTLLGAMGAVSAAALIPLGLTGCGGTRDKRASLRFVNATLDFGSLTAQLDDTVLATPAAGSATAFMAVDEKSQTLRIKTEGTTLIEQTFNPDKDSHWTALLYSVDGALKLNLYAEADGTPGAGQCRLRVFNAAESGSVDVFLTSDDIIAVPPVLAAAAEAQFSGFAQTASGARRLRITTAGNRTDVRLDLPAFNLPSDGVVTLVVLPTRSAKLLQALALVQGGASQSLANPLGRVRFVNGLSVVASPLVDNASVLGVLASGGVSAAVNAAAGDRSLGFGVNGTPVVQTRSVAAAADVSCVVHGDAAAPQIAFLDDDNRSAASSTQVKLRLANFAAGVSSATLVVDLSAEGVTAAAGAASVYTQVAVGKHRLAVNASTGTALGALADQDLLTDGVYTLFLLGSAASPLLVLRRDR